MADPGGGSSSDVEKQTPNTSLDQNRDSNVGICYQLSEAKLETIAKKVLECLFELSISYFLRLILVCFTGDADYIDVSSSTLWSCGRSKHGKEVTPGDNGTSQEGSQVCPRKEAAMARKEKLRRKGLVLASRLGCLAAIWLTINLSIPSLKRMTLMGSALWKWSLFLAIIFLGFPFKHFAIKMLLDLANVTGKFQGSDTEYWFEGLKASARPVIYFTCNLIIWLIFFFTARDQLSSTYRTIHKYIILTLVSALVAAFLWLAKSTLMLFWKAKHIYRPNKEKILAAGFQLHFLLLLFRRTSLPKLMPDKVKKILSSEDPRKTRAKETSMTGSGLIEHHFFEKSVGLQDVNEVAIRLSENFKLRLTEDNDAPDIDPNTLDNILTKFSAAESLNSYIGESDATLLLKVLSEDPHDDYGEWLREANRNFYLLSHKINGDFELTAILNRVLNGSILVFVGLLWLFITELATTRLIVTMGSFFLGLSFAFGDTCKTFFQGFVFTFVTHPLDVGDPCSIDDKKELEVKRIKLLTTTFYEIVRGRRTDVLIYPNSDLATKRIIKLQAQPKGETLQEASQVDGAKT